MRGVLSCLAGLALVAGSQAFPSLWANEVNSGKCVDNPQKAYGGHGAPSWDKCVAGADRIAGRAGQQQDA